MTGQKVMICFSDFMFTVVTNNDTLVETDYFDSVPAKNGALFITWSNNGKTAFMLVPNKLVSYLANELMGAKSVLMKPSGELIVIRFDDGTDTPLEIKMSKVQMDREIGYAHSINLVIQSQDGPVKTFTGKTELEVVH